MLNGRAASSWTVTSCFRKDYDITLDVNVSRVNIDIDE